MSYNRPLTVFTPPYIFSLQCHIMHPPDCFHICLTYYHCCVIMDLPDRFHTPLHIIIAVSCNAPPDHSTSLTLLLLWCHIMHPLTVFTHPYIIAVPYIVPPPPPDCFQTPPYISSLLYHIMHPHDCFHTPLRYYHYVLCHIIHCQLFSHRLAYYHCCVIL